ncbi:hypothetical protein HCH_03304 [Hahella chejuensis KCTC 2396]|uniref:Uncharacterized protein n=1 Tax=Hahella chejuensis (strain KCTC 2396) TaxID=349521 RepID=Q2SH15_HAHCH|nr:hypothetical protein HCH_03304 [Hahella chejuensis KCTC 2396]
MTSWRPLQTPGPRGASVSRLWISHIFRVKRT